MVIISMVVIIVSLSSSSLSSSWSLLSSCSL
jgi:hypothetical protein